MMKNKRGVSTVVGVENNLSGFFRFSLPVQNSGIFSLPSKDTTHQQRRNVKNE